MPLFQTRDGRVARFVARGENGTVWQIFSRGILAPYDGVRDLYGNDITGDENNDIVPVMATPREDKCLIEICAAIGISRPDLHIDQEQPMIEALREYKGW